MQRKFGFYLVRPSLDLQHSCSLIHKNFNATSKEQFFHYTLVDYARGVHTVTEYFNKQIRIFCFTKNFVWLLHVVGQSA